MNDIRIAEEYFTGWDWARIVAILEEYDDVEVFENTELAEELLPTQSGFFFGGTEYDQWYVHGLDETINQIEPLLQEEGDGDFYYQASW